MSKFLSTLILLSVVLSTSAQRIPVPDAPNQCNASNCITNANIDVCRSGDPTIVSTHIDGRYHRGNANNQLAAGAVWRYRNMAVVSGVTINCEVTVDEVYNARLASMDDDGARNENNQSIASYFAPRISSDVNLSGTSGDRRGFVQFTMRFFKNAGNANSNTDADFGTPVNLANLNYVHYDIDGFVNGPDMSGSAPGTWFRETGAARALSASNPRVRANGTTDLSRYDYTDGQNWFGYAGGVCERDGVSNCAQNVAAYAYTGAQPSITFRMGYDYNRGSNVGTITRQYGSRLGCFNFPEESTLPVSLLSFNAIFKNNVTSLKWIAENEENFDKYLIERSTDGRNFSSIGEQKGQGSGRVTYDYSDNLSSESSAVFYYRLKMLDIDSRFTYSSVVMVRKEEKAINGIMLSPNPVRSGITTVRFMAARQSTADIRVIDVSGKVLVQQQTKVYEGTNSLNVTQLDKLMPGVYTMQVINEGEASYIKFSVVR